MSGGVIKALDAFRARHRAWPLVLLHRAAAYGLRRLVGPRAFTFRGRRLPYRVHPYILDNERTVEIPIALDAVARRSADKPRILEVGHVLQPYAAVPRTIVDKYEEAPGVLNVDIVDFAPPERFDLILCLSTLEHVGRDEEPRDPGKALRAYRHLQTLLAPGGELLVTVPAGYHPELDRALAGGELGGGDGHHTTALKRHGRFNRWRECAVTDALARPFGSRYACANGLLVVSWKRTSASPAGG
ncbi:MAG: hypothetical protein AAGF23_01520 [Acidobacteriota bacterium]